MNRDQNIRRALGTDRPETGMTVRAAVVERLVGTGMDRRRAEREAEQSWRRVNDRLDQIAKGDGA
jgi:hypothetical protein